MNICSILCPDPLGQLQIVHAPFHDKGNMAKKAMRARRAPQRFAFESTTTSSPKPAKQKKGNAFYGLRFKKSRETGI